MTTERTDERAEAMKAYDIAYDNAIAASEERVDVTEQIDQLAEFLMEHTPVGIYGNMGAIEHAIAHIKQLQSDHDQQRTRAERAEADAARLREALMEIEQRHQEWAEREYEQGLPSWGSECEAFADAVRHILKSALTTATADEKDLAAS